MRLKVQDRNKFIADMKASGMSVREMGNEVDKAGKLFQSGTHHGFLWNQMLFTIRRTIYSVTLALGAMAAAALTVGFRFNIMLEQQSLAFRRFTGSVAGATREVDFLFNLAAHGPFEFQQVIQGSRQLMAFGFTVERTNVLLTNLQDAMAGMGLDQTALDRATLALGQIQASGRLLGQDLRQLEQLGLVNPHDLARRLGVDPTQIANVGALNIPSKVAIDAIMAYWQSRFKGAAADFQKTWTGQWSTIKDFASQTFGYIVRDWQTQIETEIMPSVARVFTVASGGAKTGGASGAFRAIDQEYNTHTLTIYRNTSFALQQILGLTQTIIRIWIDGVARLGPFVNLLVLMGTALWVLNHALEVLAPVLSWVVSIWIAQRTALILLNVAMWLYNTRLGTTIALEILSTRFKWLLIAADYAYVTVLYVMTFAQAQWMEGAILARTATWLLTAAIYAYNAAQWLAVAATRRVIFWLIAFAYRTGIARAASYAYITALYAGSVAQYAFAAASEAVGLSFLTWLGPLALVAAALYLIIKYQDKISGWAGGGGQVKPIGGHRDKNAPGTLLGVPIDFHIPHIPGLAAGGSVVNPGSVLVGERGPEVLTLPSGARVAPLTNDGARLGLAGAWERGRTLDVRVPVYLDRRQIAEAMGQVQLDTAARA